MDDGGSGTFTRLIVLIVIVSVDLALTIIEKVYSYVKERKLAQKAAEEEAKKAEEEQKAIEALLIGYST